MGYCGKYSVNISPRWRCKPTLGGCGVTAICIHAILVIANHSMAHSRYSIGEETNVGVIARRAVCAEAIPNLLVGDCFAMLLAMTLDPER